MKKFISLALSVACGYANAQVKIGGNITAPDPSAVLELDGSGTTAKGLLLPRIRKQEMLNMLNPAEGLTVYITDEQATYLRRQSNWVKLSGAADAISFPYAGVFNTAGAVLSLSQTNNNTGTVARLSITDAASVANGLEVISNAAGPSNTGGNAAYFALTNNNSSGAAVRAETNSIYTHAAVEAICNGTGGFAGKFTLNNPSAAGDAVYAITYGNGSAVFANGSNGKGPAIEAIGNSLSPTIFAWKQTSKYGSAAGFRNSNDDNTAPVVYIQNHGTGDALQILGVNPQIKLQQSDVEKGFIQLNADDLRMGTVAANTSGQVVFRTNGADRMFVTANGTVLIGGATAPAGSNKLAVKGSIAATAFNVVATGSWPDYVFDPAYKLRSLAETEAFIAANKHLPGIPAAAEVEKNGYELSDMQKRMMEKIEELTLHLINAGKKIAQLETAMEDLKKR